MSPPLVLSGTTQSCGICRSVAPHRAGGPGYWSCKSRDIGTATPQDCSQNLREAELHTPPSPGCSWSSVADAQKQDREKDLHLTLPTFQWCFWSHSPHALKQIQEILSGTSGQLWALAIHVPSDLPSEEEVHSMSCHSSSISDSCISLGL